MRVVMMCVLCSGGGGGDRWPVVLVCGGDSGVGARVRALCVCV